MGPFGWNPSGTPFSVLEADAVSDVFSLFQFCCYGQVCPFNVLPVCPLAVTPYLSSLFVNPLPCGGTDFLLWKSHLREEPVFIWFPCVQSNWLPILVAQRRRYSFIPSRPLYFGLSW